MNASEMRFQTRAISTYGGKNQAARPKGKDRDSVKCHLINFDALAMSLMSIAKSFY
jgi:hypothetical protein